MLSPDILVNGVLVLVAVALGAVAIGPAIIGRLKSISVPNLPSLPVPNLQVLSGASDAVLEQTGFAAIQTLDHVLAHSGVSPADRKTKLDPILVLIQCHREAASNVATSTPAPAAPGAAK